MKLFKKIHVLHVTFVFRHGGTEAFILNNYRHIDRTRYLFDILTLCPEPSPFQDEINSLGGRIIYANLQPSMFHFFRFVRGLKQIIQQYGPYDTIHSHINFANSMVLYAAKHIGIHTRLSHSHSAGAIVGNAIIKPFRLLQRYLLVHSATHLLACGTEAGKALYGSRKFIVIKNGIDVELFTQKQETIQLRNELSIPTNARVYGNISRYDRNKNFTFVIDIFVRILKQHSESYLILGGQDGDQKSVVKEKIKQLKIEDKVLILDARNDLPKLNRVIDSLIFPSYYEGFPIVLLEAQASGLHIFMSDRISSEVDLGIGLIHTICISASAEEWATQILTTDTTTKPSPKSIRNIFTSSGYDIQQSAKKLEKIYS